MTLKSFLSAFSKFRQMAEEVGGLRDLDYMAQVALFRLWLTVESSTSPATDKQRGTVLMLIREGHLEWSDLDCGLSALTVDEASRLIERGFKRREGVGFGAEIVDRE